MTSSRSRVTGLRPRWMCAALSGAAALLPLLVAAVAAAAPMRLLVPAYFYPVPGSPWDQLTAQAGAAPITAIMDPFNGPGPSVDPSYTAAVTAFKAAGGELLGYVYTSYGARPLAAVTADIDTFLAWYPIDGLFVDEMANDALPAHVDYYAALYQHIKSRGANLEVVANPGVNTLESYLTRPTADVLLIFEHSEGYDTWMPSPWVYQNCPDHFAHLVYGVGSSAAMADIVALAAMRGTGYLYVTNDLLPNPWDTLPPYWAAEVSAVAGTVTGACQSGAPESPGVTPATLRAWPNPFRSSVRVQGAGPAGAPLLVTDVAGRLIRRLLAGPDGAATWDGRDEAGRSMASGLYLIREARSGRMARVWRLS